MLDLVTRGYLKRGPEPYKQLQNIDSCFFRADKLDLDDRRVCNVNEADLYVAIKTLDVSAWEKTKSNDRLKGPITFRGLSASVKGKLQHIQEPRASQRPIGMDIVTTCSGLSICRCAT